MKFKLHRPVLSILFIIGISIPLAFVLLKLPPPHNPSVLQPLACQTKGQGTSFARTELLFGMSKSNNTVVTEAEFQHFVDREVTPRFPEGLTILSAIGQFKTTNQEVVKEKSKLLLLFYPVSQNSDRDVEQIRQA